MLSLHRLFNRLISIVSPIMVVTSGIIVPSSAQTNGIQRQYFSGISGITVENLTSSANYPNNPTSTSTVTTFEGPQNAADNYGCRYRGFIVPPTTGSYTFWIASDDNSELWLSTSSDPANVVKIASVSGYCSSRQWTKYSSQQSAAITLEAGQFYYIEALHKDGSQNDNLSVGWQGPGITGDAERPIPSNRLRLWTGTQYTLTVNNDSHGTTSPSGAVTATAGVAQTITATPSNGYTFSNWTVVSGSATFGNANSSSTTVTLWSANTTIRANFSAINYTLTMTNDGNGTTNPTGSVSVGYGVPQSISATASSGYTFANWTVTSGTATIANPNNASTTVSITSNATIRANFAPSTVNLTVTNDGHGTTAPSGTVAVVPNVAQAISATPASGYTFTNWTVTSGTATIANPNSATTTVTIAAAASIRANFTQSTVNLTVTNDGHGTTVPSGTVAVVPNVEQTISATPASGYTFTNWTVTSGTATIANPNSDSTTVIISSNATIRANFSAVTYVLTITNDGNGTTVPSGAFTVPQGGAQSISATASNGFLFANWSVVTGTAAIANPTMATTTVSLSTGNATIRANFIASQPMQPNNRRVAISGTLADINGNPVGTPNAITIAVQVNITSSADGGSPLYTETFLPENSNGITVQNGRFVVTLGTGVASADLATVLAANNNCFAEITILGDTPDTLLPRTPITASPYSLGVSAAANELHGTADPNNLNLIAKIGTYYVNDTNGDTFVRVQNSWKQID